MFLEAHRGIIPALLGFLGMLFALFLTRLLYIPLSEYMQPSAAYMLLVGAAIVLIGIITTVVNRRLKMKVTAIEAAVGATLGFGTGVLISFAFFEWLAIRYGAGSVLVKNSLLYWAMMEFQGLRTIADFFRSLTGN